MRENIIIGMIAGLVATLVLSALMLTKGIVPQLDIVTLLDGVARSLMVGTNFPVSLAGWLWHFIIGTLWWGALFGVIEPILPGQRYWTKGASFGLVSGLLVWLMVLPAAGSGHFGMRLSPIQPVVTLLQHLIYGVTLGYVYGRLIDRANAGSLR
jgi:hypothetical protein